MEGKIRHAMTRTLPTTLFAVLALFFIGTAAFLSLDSFREYRAEISIIALPKGGDIPAGQVVENIAVLPTTLDFFDALLISDERIAMFSDIDEQPMAVRKAAWSEMLTVERRGESGVIAYSLAAESQEEAVLLARQMSKVLFEKIGAYYDIRSDVSIRLVEGPLVRTSVATPFLWIGMSLSFGIAAALVVTLLLSNAALWFASARVVAAPESGSSHRTAEPIKPAFHPSAFIPKKPLALFSESGEAKAHEEKWDKILAAQEAEAKRAELSSIIARTAKPVVSAVSSAAPANLPVMDENEFFAQFQATAAAQEAEAAETETVAPLAPVAPAVSAPEAEAPAEAVEPTVEEYRRRLNELLKQGK